MFVLVSDVEELGFSLSVVGRYEVANGFRQVVAVCHFLSFGNVADDNLCALDVVDHVVGIHTRLVFGKIDRVRQLTYVMI